MAHFQTLRTRHLCKYSIQRHHNNNSENLHARRYIYKTNNKLITQKIKTNSKYGVHNTDNTLYANQKYLNKPDGFLNKKDGNINVSKDKHNSRHTYYIRNRKSED